MVYQVRLVRKLQDISKYKQDNECSARFYKSCCGNFFLDNKSNLEWKVRAEKGGYSWKRAVELFDFDVTLFDKLKYLFHKKIGNLDFKDFRLPTKEEFENIFESPDISLNKDGISVFDDSSYTYWTSTFDDENSNSHPYACIANFEKKYVFEGAIFNICHVRLVRRAKNFEINKPFETRFTYSDCRRFILDNETGLEWKRVAEQGSFKWYQIKKSLN